MDKDLKANLYLNYLSEEGFRPELDSDGDVQFKMEGLTYFMEVDDRDDAFFRICLPNFWGIENDVERSQVLEAADFTNAKSKVAKIFTIQSNVWASIELFVPEPDSFRVLFPRSMSAIQNAVRSFADKMKENRQT